MSPGRMDRHAMAEERLVVFPVFFLPASPPPPVPAASRAMPTPRMLSTAEARRGARGACVTCTRVPGKGLEEGGNTAPCLTAALPPMAVYGMWGITVGGGSVGGVTVVCGGCGGGRHHGCPVQEEGGVCGEWPPSRHGGTAGNPRENVPSLTDS